jgi:hypothetical protein
MRVSTTDDWAMTVVADATKETAIKRMVFMVGLLIA